MRLSPASRAWMSCCCRFLGFRFAPPQALRCRQLRRLVERFTIYGEFHRELLLRFLCRKQIKAFSANRLPVFDLSTQGLAHWLIGKGYQQDPIACLDHPERRAVFKSISADHVSWKRDL